MRDARCSMEQRRVPSDAHHWRTVGLAGWAGLGWLGCWLAASQLQARATSQSKVVITAAPLSPWRFTSASFKVMHALTLFSA